MFNLWKTFAMFPVSWSWLDWATWLDWAGLRCRQRAAATALTKQCTAQCTIKNAPNKIPLGRTAAKRSNCPLMAQTSLQNIQEMRFESGFGTYISGFGTLCWSGTQHHRIKTTQGTTKATLSEQ